MNFEGIFSHSEIYFILVSSVLFVGVIFAAGCGSDLCDDMALRFFIRLTVMGCWNMRFLIEF